jgi:hypothetical protein
MYTVYSKIYSISSLSFSQSVHQSFQLDVVVLQCTSGNDCKII